MKDRNVTTIKKVFFVQDKNNPTWSVDQEQLADIIQNQECRDAILNDFESMQDADRFRAQVTKVSGVNTMGDEFEYIVISLGHFIYTHHYMYHPGNKSWHVTSINQDVFNDAIEPFQNSINR